MQSIENEGAACTKEESDFADRCTLTLAAAVGSRCDPTDLSR